MSFENIANNYCRFGKIARAFVSCLLVLTAGVISPALASEKIVYGINTENMKLNQETIRPGDNLAEILLNAGLPYNTIQQTINASKGVFDVRKIRVGNRYTIFTEAKTGLPRYFVYDKNSENYIVFDLDDTVTVSERQKPVEILLRSAEGEIKGSIWNTFSRLGLDGELAAKLNEIYAWTLDFYHFRKGDRFRIIFEEKWIGNRQVGLGIIRAARMVYNEETYYAFYFQEDNDKEGQYYDEEGQSLHKAFLKAPLKNVRISSGFSQSRLHPILHQYMPHLGIDYAAPSGTPVMCVGNGTVEKVEYNNSMGKYVQIRHVNKRYMTQYLHLSRSADDLKPGDTVEQGEIIGYVGRTGRATGPHLDFRFWVDGEAVNFLQHDIPTAEPIAPKLMATFMARIESWHAELDRDATRQFAADAEPEFEYFDPNG